MSATTKKEKINGVEYTLQRMPLREWIKLKSRCKEDGEHSEEKLFDEVFEHLVVSPRVSLDDFESEEEMLEVYVAAVTFQRKNGTGMQLQGTSQK